MKRVLLLIFIIVVLIAIFGTKIYSNTKFSASAIKIAPALPEKETSKPPQVVKAEQKNDYSGVTVNAVAALALDLETGKEFFSLNKEKRWPIASITKLMTSVLTIENIGKQKDVLFNESAVAAEGDAGNFAAGELYKAGDLLKAMMLVSSNDAAEALAEFYGRQQFIQDMNTKAQIIQMRDTVFGDPTGLSVLNQSTPIDLWKLSEYIFRNHKEVFDISRKGSEAVTELRSRKTKTLVNINLFAERPDFLGGKTGYIEEAQQNLISFFLINKRPVLIIVLGAEDRFLETEKILEWIYTKYGNI